MTSTDNSSSAYISRTQARNLIASIANRTRAGPGVQNIVSLGQIVSVLDLPKPPAPTELIFASTGTAGTYDICWINNAPIVIDTLIELNPGTGWRTYAHGPLLDPSAATLTGISGAVQVRVSTIGPGNVTSDPSNIVFIIVSLNQTIPVPTNLTTANSATGYGDFRLSWTNNAPNMIDTIIEINGTLFNPNRYELNGPFYGLPPDVVDTWPIYPHAPLGNANTIIVKGYETIEPRIYSVTTAGISAVVNLPFNGT
jgi:hypothetical protein